MLSVAHASFVPSEEVTVVAADNRHHLTGRVEQRLGYVGPICESPSRKRCASQCRVEHRQLEFRVELIRERMGNRHTRRPCPDYRDPSHRSPKLSLILTISWSDTQVSANECCTSRDGWCRSPATTFESRHLEAQIG
jgi:hypothetical protein